MNQGARRRQDPPGSSLEANGDLEEQRRMVGNARDSEQRSDIRGDRGNIAILFLLYLLQGIPMGLAAAIPMLLQSQVSYRQQAAFSLVNWPFSLKLLWAPIVDSFYSSRFGRRKSWLIPAQFLIGFFMLFLSANVDDWLGGDSVSPSVGLLTLMFLILNFLGATQDIAVDGWALTMLQRRNVEYASTCNSVGQSAGYFLGYVVFMTLHSPDFCNNVLRSEPLPTGCVTLSSFLQIWGWIFLVTTTLVALLKKEQAVHDPDHVVHSDLDFTRAYTLLWDIAKLPSVRLLCVILLTAKIGFSACDAVTGLKLVDAGVPKEQLSYLAVLLVPLQIVLPIGISRYTQRARSMNVYLAAVPYRLMFNLIAAAMVYLTPSIVHSGEVPIYYYAILLIFYCLQQVTAYMMFVSVMAFFVRISDPAVGGTYMTLLNTVSNLGTTWPSTLSLWMMDSLTSRKCSVDALPENFCSSTNETHVCLDRGGTCMVLTDGYYVEMVLCTVIGWLWLWYMRPLILTLQSKDIREWKMQRRNTR